MYSLWSVVFRKRRVAARVQSKCNRDKLRAQQLAIFRYRFHSRTPIEKEETEMSYATVEGSY